jgi:hypothetical protein
MTQMRRAVYRAEDSQTHQGPHIASTAKRGNRAGGQPDEQKNRSTGDLSDLAAEYDDNLIAQTETSQRPTYQNASWDPTECSSTTAAQLRGQLWYVS